MRKTGRKTTQKTIKGQIRRELAGDGRKTIKPKKQKKK
jgi:hypothetical protein